MTTPGRPPRTPGTPAGATGLLGPLARHMDSFDVMESPAVRESLAGRPPHPGSTAGNSPASLASSPGFVSGDMSVATCTAWVWLAGGCWGGGGMCSPWFVLPEKMCMWHKRWRQSLVAVQSHTSQYEQH